MKLELITLAGTKVSEHIYEVLIPTVDGDITVLPGHERLVTLARHGVVSVRKQRGDSDETMEHFATYGGIVKIAPAHVRILVDEADTADEIIEAETEEALKLARELRAAARDQVELAKAQAQIDRHAVRLRVAGLRRRHRHL